MKNCVIYLLVCSAMIFAGCSGNGSSKGELLRITAGEAIGKEGTNIMLEELSEKVLEIPLETSDISLLDDISNIVPCKDHLLVLNGGKCSLFKEDGCFVAHLGNKGNGPQEYLYIEDAFVLKDTVYLYDSSKNKIYCFNFKGEYIRSNELQINLRHSRGAAMLPSGDIAFYLPDKGMSKEWRALTIMDTSGNLKDSIVMASKLASLSNINWYFKECSFVGDGKWVRFKYMFNDTVYNIIQSKGKYEIVPAYVFELGNYKAIENAREEVVRTMMQPKMFNPFQVMAKTELLGENKNLLFFMANGHRGYFFKKKTGEVLKYNISGSGNAESDDTFKLYFLDNNSILWGSIQKNVVSNPVILKIEADI